MQKNGGLQTTDSEGLNSGMDEQPLATGETVDPVEQSDDKPGVTDEVPHTPESDELVQETVTKPETESTTETDSPNSTETDLPKTAETDLPKTAETDLPKTAETDSTSTTETDPPISEAQKYEQEIIQVQAMCTKDMKEVLSGAESSIQQLDKTDPYAVQAWKEKLTKELAAAESKCDGKFQEVTQNAEKNSVSPKVIEEWQQTFSALKVKLQEESQAKLRQLMGG